MLLMFKRTSTKKLCFRIVFLKQSLFLCVALNSTICHKKKQRYKIEAKNAELK